MQTAKRLEAQRRECLPVRMAACFKISRLSAHCKLPISARPKLKLNHQMDSVANILFHFFTDECICLAWAWSLGAAVSPLDVAVAVRLSVFEKFGAQFLKNFVIVFFDSWIRSYGKVTLVSRLFVSFKIAILFICFKLFGSVSKFKIFKECFFLNFFL